MANLDLDQDYMVNGHEFKAGKNVSTTVDEPDPETGKTKKVDYADSLQEMMDASRNAADYASTHHGAVPTPDDPNEATAQTPTRPLAGPNVRADESASGGVDQSNVHEVKDPVDNSADESNKTAQKGK